MSIVHASSVGRPIWIDLTSSDPAASRDFYAKVLGWQIEVTADPQFGGYAIARSDGKDVAGIGPAMMADAPSAWSVYIGTDDATELTARVQAAGGMVVAPPMQVGDAGRMAVFQDPSGAFIGAWQPQAMPGFVSGTPNSFTWAELNARGFERAARFYRDVFGWTAQTYPMGEGRPTYTQFLLGPEMVAGGLEMNPLTPAGRPSHWRVFFGVDDADATYQRAIAAGAKETLAPQDFPGGRVAILTDPQGASFTIRSTKG
ncbi:MAG: VOC family protein [Candidatus Limnocylindrales bacterium]|jgi:predicted enzyme related to lactoylglutathione lyase